MYVVLSAGSSADSKWRLTELCFLPAQHDRARMPNSWSQAYTSQLLWRTNVSVDGLCHGPGRTLMQLSSFGSDTSTPFRSKSYVSIAFMGDNID